MLPAARNEAPKSAILAVFGGLEIGLRCARSSGRRSRGSQTPGCETSLRRACPCRGQTLAGFFFCFRDTAGRCARLGIAGAASFAVAPAGRVGAGDCKPVMEANPPRIFNSAAAAAASISSASIVIEASQQALPPDAEIANKRSVVGSIA